MEERKRLVVKGFVHGVRLTIALASPDFPCLIGLLDEGVYSVLFGWAVNDAVHGGESR